MRSLLVEFHRFGDLDTGMWRKDDRYLVAAAAHRVREFAMPLDQDGFLDLVADLRYQTTADARRSALNEVGRVATAFLGSAGLEDMDGGSFPLQLDLVVNPAELAALPFEAATDRDGRPLFARGDQPVILTRRVRHEFAENGLRWPARPRILFAWAAPAQVGEVPHEEHARALEAALEPWIGPDDGNDGKAAVLTVLPEVKLADLVQACRAAVDAGKPFTHVHLLAHGYPVGHAHRQRVGIALHASDGDLAEATPEEMKQALSPLAGHAVVITLAACDSANLANTTTSGRSIVHELHVAGFPIVVGSQLPLTKIGSSLMVAMFYRALLAGTDVRLALHRTRVGLYEQREQTGHDWASLVGYARLPEGYADHLHHLRLDAGLAALKTIQGCSDRLVAAGSAVPERYDRVAQQLQARISALEGCLTASARADRRGVLEENFGLLGSAEKRRAELCFVRSTLGDRDKWQREMCKALARAHRWYLKCARRNLSHHWAGVQYLSLEAVLRGRIADTGLWHAAVSAAEIDRRSARPMDVIWALGSLLELHLLAPLTGQPEHASAAAAAWQEMQRRVGELDPPDAFPVESTRRQLRRYVDWWTTPNGFFRRGPDLAAEAAALLER